jgi:hypothetical protein
MIGAMPRHEGIARDTVEGGALTIGHCRVVCFQRRSFSWAGSATTVPSPISTCRPPASTKTRLQTDRQLCIRGVIYFPFQNLRLNFIVHQPLAIAKSTNHGQMWTGNARANGLLALRGGSRAGWSGRSLQMSLS